MPWSKCSTPRWKKTRNPYIHPCFFLNSYHRVMAWSKCGPEVEKTKEMHAYIHFIFLILTTG